jgi:chemotaxis protein histidine kinase CheA
VIKNLGRFYRNVQVVSGATILGNGTVALILDPHRLVQNVVQSVSQGLSQGLSQKKRSDGRSNSVDRQDSRQATQALRKENRIDDTKSKR